MMRTSRDEQHDVGSGVGSSEADAVEFADDGHVFGVPDDGVRVGIEPRLGEFPPVVVLR